VEKFSTITRAIERDRAVGRRPLGGEDHTNFMAALAMRIRARRVRLRESAPDGSHWVGEKHGVARPIVIPEYNEIGLDIIQANMRTAKMSRERYFKLLREC
jgi:hypothetical protein